MSRMDGRKAHQTKPRPFDHNFSLIGQSVRRVKQKLYDKRFAKINPTRQTRPLNRHELATIDPVFAPFRQQNLKRTANVNRYVKANGLTMSKWEMERRGIPIIGKWGKKGDRGGKA